MDRQFLIGNVAQKKRKWRDSEKLIDLVFKNAQSPAERRVLFEAAVDRGSTPDECFTPDPAGRLCVHVLATELEPSEKLRLVRSLVNWQAMSSQDKTKFQMERRVSSAQLIAVCLGHILCGGVFENDNARKQACGMARALLGGVRLSRVVDVLREGVRKGEDIYPNELQAARTAVQLLERFPFLTLRRIDDALKKPGVAARAAR